MCHCKGNAAQEGFDLHIVTGNARSTSESILMLHDLGLYSPSQVSYFTHRGLHRRLYSACIMCRLHRTQHGFYICLLAMLHFAKQLPLLCYFERAWRSGDVVEQRTS